MTRKLAVVLVAGLLLAPAASAKGPHAVLSFGPEAAEPGRPWTATLEFNEFRRPPHPRVVATRGDRRVAGELRPVATHIAHRASFRLRMVLPSAGRWRLRVSAAKRRFAFPGLDVGSGVVPKDYAAFPRGSYAARQSAGGTWVQVPDADAGGRGAPLPPEVVSAAEPSHSGGRDGDGIPLWMPVLGLALAGAGLVGLRART
jgi:hypothetical protein